LSTHIKSINLTKAHERFDDVWSPRKIASVDNYDVKLAKCDDEFVWHAHEDEDELFLVQKGVLRIEIENADPIILGPGEMTVIPKGVRHKPVAQDGPVHILLLERAGVINTGDAQTGELTNPVKDLDV
jgi:mannose-6-phosphate isomerase-like protein (cupin superfamily)